MGEAIAPYGLFHLSISEVIGIIGILITIAALAFTVFTATYSTFLHSSEQAWVNWRLETRIGERDYWRYLAEDYRGGSQRRASAGNLSLYSLALAIMSLFVAVCGIHVGEFPIFCFWMPFVSTLVIHAHFPLCSLLASILNLPVAHTLWLILFETSIGLLVASFIIFLQELTVRIWGPLGRNLPPSFWSQPQRRNADDNIRDERWRYP
jgi:hypothetical protein